MRYKFTFSLIVFTVISTSIAAQTQQKLVLQSKNTYAGIEVGSKGVKISIIEMSAAKSISYRLLKDSSVNTDFISFTGETFKNTLNGLAGLYQFASTHYSLKPDQIFTVFSSGVKAVADREKKTEWLSRMSDSFKIRINEPERSMKTIDVMDEARLSHLGIIPEPKRFTTFLIDIGSGNTKGGYFPTDNLDQFKLFQLTWGTKSISNSTEKRLDDDKTLPNFQKQMMRVLSGQAEDEITYAVNVSGAYNMSDNVAFSGGIVWAAATLMFPELIDNPVVPVTYQDVVAYNKRIFEYYETLSDSAISASLQDPGLDLDRITGEVKKVNKVFDQRALMSGTGLLLKIMRQFEGLYDRKQFYFVKNGQVGWISAYVNQSLSR